MFLFSAGTVLRMQHVCYNLNIWSLVAISCSSYLDHKMRLNAFGDNRRPMSLMASPILSSQHQPPSTFLLPWVASPKPLALVVMRHTSEREINNTSLSGSTRARTNSMLSTPLSPVVTPSHSPVPPSTAKAQEAAGPSSLAKPITSPEIIPPTLPPSVKEKQSPTGYIPPPRHRLHCRQFRSIHRRHWWSSSAWYRSGSSSSRSRPSRATRRSRHYQCTWARRACYDYWSTGWWTYLLLRSINDREHQRFRACRSCR